ncbi:hypothetical protein ACMGGD_16025 [Pseudomonas sp. BNK-6]|uniref:hypothetical protein n=1 Tax=unclassified Pseudomonas TaxID=196821 RepID=UPI003A843340
MEFEDSESLKGEKKLSDKVNAVLVGGKGFVSLANIRDVALLLLFFVIAYRLAVSEISIDFSGFNFTDLLSLILAISAIVLSAAFYFKADESSKNFYNNSYGFTKNISELLGRIEERFGAQLLSINQGYDVLNKRFDSIPFDATALKEEQRKEADTLKKSEEEYQKIIEDLMVKAQLDEKQMADMRASMASLAAEVDRSKGELLKHSVSLESYAGQEGFDGFGFLSEDLYMNLSSLVRRSFNGGFVGAGLKTISEHFSKLVMDGEVSPRIVSQLREAGLYGRGSLSISGARTIQKMINAIFQ